MDYNQEKYFQMQQAYYQKMPYFMAYPLQNVYMTEMEYDKDMDKMKEWYPKTAKIIQKYAEDECNRLEYEGSLMYDEYPDQVMLHRICEKIYDKIDAGKDKEILKNEHMKDMIEVILYNEMFKRRCRYHRCKRWW